MKKRLLLPAFAIVLVAGATLWAINDRDKPGAAPPRPGVGPPAAPPGGGPPGGVGAPGLQPPGGAGFGGQPPGGFGGQPPGGFGGQKIDYKEVLPTLIASLDDDDGDVRKAIAVTLARIGQPAVDPLVDVLKNKDKSKAARANAAYVLGRIGSPARDAIPALTKALKEADRDLRRRAAFALAHVIASGDFQGGMVFGGGGGMPGGMGGFGGRRGGDDLPDPGVVLPGHEKSSDKIEEKPD